MSKDCKLLPFVALNVLVAICLSTVSFATFAQQNGLSLISAAEVQARTPFVKSRGLPRNASEMRNANQLHTFTSPDGVFRFKYSDLLVRCSEIEVPGGRAWEPNNACTSYFPICGQLISQGGSTIECFAFRKGIFKDDDRDFEAGTFLVKEIKEAVSENQCLSVFPDWDVDSHGTGKTQVINGATFKAFNVGEGLMGQRMTVEMYRNFHKDKCYELSVNIALIDPDPGVDKTRDFSEEDWNRVHESLEQPLHSFKFVK